MAYCNLLCYTCWGKIKLVSTWFYIWREDLHVFIIFLFWISGNSKTIIIEARLTTVHETSTFNLTRSALFMIHYGKKYHDPHTTFFQHKDRESISRGKNTIMQCLSLEFVQVSTAPVFVENCTVTINIPWALHCPLSRCTDVAFQAYKTHSSGNFNINEANLHKTIV